MSVEELVKEYAAGYRDFRGVDLTNAMLRGIDLSGTEVLALLCPQIRC